MKTKSAWLAFTAVGVSALMASCGGSSSSDDDPGSSGKSTSGGKAGASSAGTSSSGNTSSAGTTANAGTSSGGKASTGGSANTGGRNNTGGFNFGGVFGIGGAFDPSDFACNPVPKTGTACEANTQPCVDGANVCYCNQLKWACQNVLGGGAGGDGPGQIDCPADQPMSGDDCGDTQGLCQYGNGGCACYMGKWACL